MSIPPSIKPKIMIEPSALRYIRNKGDSVWVTYLQCSGGCAVCMSKPAVLVGKPQKPENFFSFQVSGIQVYLLSKLAERMNTDTITISLNADGKMLSIKENIKMN
jgi:hypothetical protein